MTLPVAQIVRATYETIGQHGRRFLFIAFVLAMILLGLAELVWAFAIEATDDLAVLSLIDSLAWILFAPLVTAATEIHWFRILLLREQHRGSAYVRLGMRELRYAAVSFVVWASVSCPYLLAYQPLIQPRFVSEASFAMPLLIYAGATIASIALSIVMAVWLSPLLAAIAVDREHQGPVAIVRLARGHRLRFALVFLLGYEVLKIPTVPLELLVGDSLYGFGFWSIIYATYSMWLLFCYVAVVAEVYWVLDSGRQVRELGAVFD
jgi:hypothetical protein